MQSSNNDGVVRPFGRIGKAYRLSSRVYLVYRAYSWFCWTFLIIFSGLTILFKQDYIGSVYWPHTMSFALAIAFILISLAGKTIICKYGIAIIDRRDKLISQNRLSPYDILIFLLAILVALMMSIASYIKISKHQPPGIVEIVLLAACAYVFGKTVSKVISKK
jgi:hypothetical protein